MNKKLSSTLLLGLIAGSQAFGVTDRQPRIVVGIVVDQLRTDYLEQLLPYFGEGGFNRLINEAVYIPDVDFHNAVSDGTAGSAVVYTGAWPSVNGVASAEQPDASKTRTIPTLSDHSKLKIEYTPENLKVSTLADEFLLSAGNLAKVYSVAGNPQMAVVGAGHDGNAAIWLDEGSGKWTSPTYYGTMPSQVANRNRVSPLTSKMTATAWRPLNTTAIYGQTAANWQDGDFSYSFSGGNRDAIVRFKEAAPFNAEVTDMALELLKNAQTGQPIMINLAYSVAPYSYDFNDDNRPELVDTYVRLDREIGRLLDALDREYGKGGSIVFLTSSGYAAEPLVPEGNSRIPTGEITLRQAESLLNSYLSASYGNADYVAFIRNGKLYLDSQAAEKKGVDIRTLRREAKEFLLRMGGVSEVVTIDEALHSESPKARELSLGIYAKNTPDLFIYFTPGWTLTDDNVFPAKSEKIRLSSPLTPAFILAPDLQAQTMTSTVDATSLAPTMAGVMRIRSPNGASARPLALPSNKSPKLTEFK